MLRPYPLESHLSWQEARQITRPRVLQRTEPITRGLLPLTPSHRGRHIRAARSTERIDGPRENIELLGRNGHMPRSAGDQAVDVCRPTTTCRRVVPRAAPVEERIDALTHELDFLLVLQRSDQCWGAFCPRQCRQTTACHTAVVDQSRRR